ncbi:hypothetical protein PpBr36_01452 [Pyricularia pennisetigena]|uniref:hypothetical protein n=1 Tax=Pyricularia pennisetigena TaxID=1578925 RepID=UPI00114D6D5A|nr:hypothetical protein PpBr36_01452 [Pyricularia pennisetigena]TLS29706.1 hypothetical protein PpBr36_01452 [Pyricularia pennisetigena]
MAAQHTQSHFIINITGSTGNVIISLGEGTVTYNDKGNTVENQATTALQHRDEGGHDLNQHGRVHSHRRRQLIPAYTGWLRSTIRTSRASKRKKRIRAKGTRGTRGKRETRGTRGTSIKQDKEQSLAIEHGMDKHDAE